MKAQKTYLATALVLSGASTLHIAGLVVADSPNEAYSKATRLLTAPKDGNFVSKVGTPLQITARTLVALPPAAFNELFLSGALPVLTEDGQPFVRKFEVLSAVSGFKANQLAACLSLPKGEDLEVILRSYLQHTKLELTETEFLAALTLLSQSEPATA